MPAQLESEKPHFVWVVGQRGLEPQRWSSLDYGLGGWRKNSVRAVFPLSGYEARLSLNELTKIYPAPDDEVYYAA